MEYESFNDISLISEDYIKFSGFDSIFENFVYKMDLKDKNQCYISNKYLFATIVACIEGNILIDDINNSWNIWLMQVNSELECSSKSTYILLNIYEFVKSNNEFFNFITEYFNLWHENNISEFTYDKYHKKDLEENYSLLAYIVKEGIEKARNGKEENVEKIYNKLYDILLNAFNDSKRATC